MPATCASFVKGLSLGSQVNVGMILSAPCPSLAISRTSPGLYPGLDQITLQVPKYVLPTGKKTATVRIVALPTGQVVIYELNSN